MEEIEFKVFTLNCWDIPLLTKDRGPRMEAIAAVLATSDYDFICLQEVWTTTDFILIRDNVMCTYPFSHYFHSGVIGSGLCIFSKYPLEDVFFRQWSVNGYIHKLQHGDWFGGKGVGLCCIQVNGYKINVYTAHLHAEYNQAFDEYQAHRVLQAFDTAQFIQLTSAGADLIILAGDLNTEPGSLAYRIFMDVTGLSDAFNEADIVDKEFLFTNEAHTNSYTSESFKSKCPGKRIDYIMYSTGSNINVVLKSFIHPLPARVPGCKFSYSDHEAIAATVLVERKDVPVRAFFDVKARTKVLDECIGICDEALKHLLYQKRIYWFLTALLFMILITVVATNTPFSLRVFFQIAKIIITIIMCFTFVMGTLWNKIERNAILAGKLAMQIKQQI